MKKIAIKKTLFGHGFLYYVGKIVRYAVQAFVCVMLTLCATALGSYVANAIAQAMLRVGFIGEGDLLMVFIILLSGICGASFVEVPKTTWNLCSKLVNFVGEKVKIAKAKH